MYKNFANQLQDNPNKLDELDKLKSRIFASFFQYYENEIPAPVFYLFDGVFIAVLFQGFQLQCTLSRCYNRLWHHQCR